MPYIPFTEEEKQLANNVDLSEFLRIRGEKLERAGREYKLLYNDGSGKHDSITIRGSTWFDHKNQVGGGAIKFMQYHYGMDFPSAVQALLGHSVEAVKTVPHSKKVPEQPKEFRLPEKNGDMHRVYAYLIKQRYIAPEVITHFAKAQLLFEDKVHHNAVFVGVDEIGTPRQAHIRSTNSYGKSFRITAEGSDTKYSFAHFGNNDKIYVFEAPIDMLSFITLDPDKWQDSSYIAMNGVYENSVINALDTHSNLKKIILCTDNDEGGIDAADRLTDVLREHGYTDISRKIPMHKDWNEDLKALNGADTLQAVSHMRKKTFYQTVSNLKYFRCDAAKLPDRLSKTYNNRQYRYLAEYALAASAFFIAKNNEEVMFGKLKCKLSEDYRAYSDKGKMCAKQADLKSAYMAVMLDMKTTSRTREQTIQTSKMLFELADCAVRCETEQQMNEPKIEISQSDEPSEDVHLQFG